MAQLVIRVNQAQLRKLTNRIDPSRGGKAWVVPALTEAAELTQSIITTKKIRRGGRFRGPAGPRGGRGAIQSAPAHPTMLTSRSGRLRGSIAVNRGPLPRAIEVGTDVVYAAIHEKGGSIHISDRMRRVLHAKGIHPRASTTRITMPARPYFEPGLDEASLSFEKIFVRRFERTVKR
jgi:phage gpG-like protein